MAKRENNYAFIDSQNLQLGVKALGWELDHKKFRTYLRDRFHVREAYLFIGFVATNQTLYTYLKKAGYQLIYKPTLVMPGGKVKGNVDAELVLHTMIQYANFDKAVVVTGDGDFHCLIDYLNSHDKLKRVVIPNRNGCSKLIGNHYAGMKTFLDGTESKLARNKNGNQKGDVS